MPFRFPISASRFPVLLLFFVVFLLPAAMTAAQEHVSPLPPPVTRGLYRSRWFEFLNAHLEDDARGAAAALAELKKAAQAVGVRRLSDFSRTATFEGRLAENRGRFERAARAYDAALELDDANSDAHFARLAFLLRRGARGGAASAVTAALGSLVATRENRLALFSALAVWAAAGLGLATAASILILLVRHHRLSLHSLGETARRFFGGGAALPLGWIIAILPLAFGLGPMWLLLYWGALAFSGSQRGERGVLAAAFVVLGLTVPLLARVSYENILQRSPVYVAAADLEERREDASAEDGLRQASAVFSDDPDVWLLLGIYAERSSDRDRALAAYDKAVRTGPERYQGFLHRGNIHFQEGDFAQAVRDYEAATERAPRSTEAFYNLALARAESYDFEGQGDALRRARAISARDVAAWSSHPTLAKVVSVSYPVSRARAKIEEWNREPRGARLPGHAPPAQPVDSLSSPFAIGPWAALAAGLLLYSIRSWRGAASECVQCGRPHCKYCRRYGDPPGYCVSCARSRKESRGIDAQVRRAEQMKRTIRSRNVSCRLLSLFFPGTHRFFSRKPLSGFLQLFVFFFLVAAAVMHNRFFGPRQYAAGARWSVPVIVAAVLAGILWLTSLWASWRRSHGA